MIVGTEVTHEITEQNWQGSITYRLEHFGPHGMGWWSYKPEHRGYWTQVLNYHVCHCLDRGLHPRAKAYRLERLS